MEKGLCWTTSAIDIESYVRYWTDDPDRLRAVKRSEWDEWLPRLIADGVFAAKDEQQFDTDFRRTRRQEAVPRPGVAMSRSWTAPEATASDFGRTLREAINEALDALREPRIAESGFEPVSAASGGEVPTALQEPQPAPAPAPPVLPPNEWVHRERIPGTHPPRGLATRPGPLRGLRLTGAPGIRPHHPDQPGRLEYRTEHRVALRDVQPAKGRTRLIDGPRGLVGR